MVIMDVRLRAATRNEFGVWKPEQEERHAGLIAASGQLPLAQARDLLDRVDTVENRLDYALLLLAAQQTSAARAQLEGDADALATIIVERVLGRRAS